VIVLNSSTTALSVFVDVRVTEYVLRDCGFRLDGDIKAIVVLWLQGQPRFLCRGDPSAGV
jgi:hypothetical protein